MCSASKGVRQLAGGSVSRLQLRGNIYKGTPTAQRFDTSTEVRRVSGRSARIFKSQINSVHAQLQWEVDPRPLISNSSFTP